MSRSLLGAVIVAIRLESRTLDARRRNIGLQTPLAAAAALAAVALDDDMTELAGKTVVAVDHLAVGDEARTESRAERDHHEVAHAFGVAVNHLADRRGIGVVGHQHLHAAETSADIVGQRKETAALVGIGVALAEFPKVGGILDRTLVEIGVGGADADARQARIRTKDCPPARASPDTNLRRKPDNRLHEDISWSK